MSATGKPARTWAPMLQDFREAGHFGFAGTPAIALVPAQRARVLAALSPRLRAQEAAVAALVGDIARLLFDAREARRILPDGRSVREAAERLADGIDQLRRIMVGVPDAAWMRIRAEHTGLRVEALPEQTRSMNDSLTLIEVELERLSASARRAASELQAGKGERHAEHRRAWLRARLADAFGQRFPGLSVKASGKESPFARVFVVVQELADEV